jgi:hypothetical protein
MRFPISVALCAVALGCGSFDAASAAPLGSVDADGGPAELDSAGADAGPAPLAWEGDSTDGWTISNRDGTRTRDCCGVCATGCTSAAAATCDNTLMTATDKGTIVFDSGPALSKGDHRNDGFYARRKLAVRPGVKYTVAIGVTNLEAHLTGPTGGEPDQIPTWDLGVRDGSGKVLGHVGGSWATARCGSCLGAPADLGEARFDFDADDGNLELVLTAGHHSSQCPAEVYSVRVEVDYLRVRER